MTVIERVGTIIFSTKMENQRSPWHLPHPRIPRNSRIAGCISAAYSFDCDDKAVLLISQLKDFAFGYFH